jgi:hypothetical protein
MAATRPSGVNLMAVWKCGPVSCSIDWSPLNMASSSIPCDSVVTHRGRQRRHLRRVVRASLAQLHNHDSGPGAAEPSTWALSGVLSNPSPLVKLFLDLGDE